MPTIEAIFPDGSLQQSFADGSFVIDGELAMLRYQVISAKHGLKWNLQTGGHIRRGYTQDCLALVSHLTGKTYKRSRKGKEEAVGDCDLILGQLEALVVVMEVDE